MLSRLCAVLWVIAVAGSFGGVASAQRMDTLSANFWLPKCGARMGSTDFGECLAFFQGWDSGIRLYQDMARRNNSGMALSPYCLPQGASIGQMINVTNSYAWRYPAQTHLEFGLFISMALTDAYPCLRR